MDYVFPHKETRRIAEAVRRVEQSPTSLIGADDSRRTAAPHNFPGIVVETPSSEIMPPGVYWVSRAQITNDSEDDDNARVTWAELPLNHPLTWSGPVSNLCLDWLPEGRVVTVFYGYDKSGEQSRVRCWMQEAQRNYAKVLNIWPDIGHYNAVMLTPPEDVPEGTVNGGLFGEESTTQIELINAADIGASAHRLATGDIVDCGVIHVGEAKLTAAVRAVAYVERAC